MSGKARWEYFRTVYPRYRKASKEERSVILNEFCKNCGYNRKYAIRLLNGQPPGENRKKRRKRRQTYGPQVISILAAIWKAAGYPWSTRLKALLPLWMPWAEKRFHLTPQVQLKLLRISPRQMDRRLKDRKIRLRKGIYGRTKPGTLLKHHIPLKTDSWDVTVAGFTEIDLVSHPGNSAEGEFIHSLNMVDIHTTWVETRAVMGKGQTGIVNAMDEMRRSLPFVLKGIDSDNGSEFINHHLFKYSQKHSIQFTRGRPYKKDDNAHVEQKNWTHVRKIFGYVRYDSTAALEAMNDLYRNELCLLQNFFLPSLKLVRKTKVGSRTRRVYDKPQTPLERLSACGRADKGTIVKLKKLRDSLDPFALSETIDKKLEGIFAMARENRSRQTPKTESSRTTKQDALNTVSELFGIPILDRTRTPSAH